MSASPAHPTKPVTEPVTELILGGQKSGKSRRAEDLARDWLARGPDRRAVLLATAEAHDDEMRARIERHRRDRAHRVPGLETLESIDDLAGCLRRLADPRTLIVIDCLTLWLTAALMPPEHASRVPRDAAAVELACTGLVEAVRLSPGPVVLVSNEIGLGVIPMGGDVRRFVDQLGLLHQRLAQVCPRVSLMAAGLRLSLREPDA